MLGGGTLINFTAADLAIVTVVTLSALLGAARGFSRVELTAPLRWALALVLALLVSNYIEVLIPVSWNVVVIDGVEYYLRDNYPTLIGMFMFLLFNVIFINIIYLFDKREAGNMVFGFVYGIARGLLVIAALIIFIQASPLSEHPFWSFSSLVEPIFEFTVTFVDALPGNLGDYIL